MDENEYLPVEGRIEEITQLKFKGPQRRQSNLYERISGGASPPKKSLPKDIRNTLVKRRI
ncbi:hypothetical protein C922_05370 [Plasmodium inui San Antonio 1]|uniref:Uncharacterized protein n=1 Tax=Plasmodium inui San Antonio 1 TaxID=1237626 RepID=W6ZY91_9APIC|nr:hypothetical protein C922_05370 [Plasmodium inui San Antonio 1]EUD64255.1 hypothetical protein C922_05370 [Plasmodium inui San Antonio 1]